MLKESTQNSITFDVTQWKGVSFFYVDDALFSFEGENRIPKRFMGARVRRDGFRGHGGIFFLDLPINDTLQVHFYDGCIFQIALDENRWLVSCDRLTGDPEVIPDIPFQPIRCYTKAETSCGCLNDCGSPVQHEINKMKADHEPGDL